MMRIGLILGMVVLADAVLAEGVPLAEKLIAEYGAVQTLRCDVRRETVVDGQRIDTLSRVWFERPDRLSVESVTPEVRRIVVDGVAIHKWMEDHAEGVRIPLSEAMESELIQVRKTPGTAEEYLMRLRGLPEIELPAKDGFPVRRGYQSPTPHPFTVLALDEKGRLARLEYFDSQDQTNRLVQVDFAGWKEAGPGLWFPCLQKTIAAGRDGTSVLETLRVGSLVVNEPIAPERFNAASQAAGVRFVSVDEMSAILKQKGAPQNKDAK